MRVFLINLFSQTSKSMIFCEASATSQGSHKMLRLPQLLPLCHVCAALTMRFMKKALWTRHKMLHLPSKCETPHCKVLRLPGENDTLALDTLPKYCACHAKREDDLLCCDFEAPKRAFRARLPSHFTCRGNLPQHLRKLSRMAVN